MIKKRQAKHVRSYLETSQLRRRRRRRRLFARIFLLVILAVIIAGFLFLLKIKALQVDAIEVSGVTQLSADEIKLRTMDSIISTKHWLGLVPTTSTFFVDEEGLEKMLAEDFPAIQSVTAHTTFGGTVEISIREREATAIWCSSLVGAIDRACYQMDGDGYVFMPETPTTAASNFIAFKGLLTESGDEAPTKPIIGQVFLSKKEITAFKGIRESLATSGKEIEYVECESRALCLIKIMRNGVLKVDPQGDLETAFDRLSAALTSPVFVKSPFEYIDLRFGNKLFYKLTNGQTNTSSVAPSSTGAAETSTATGTETGTEDDR
jgi:hypothetical protein